MAFNLVRYSQQDPQWKNNKIGGGPDTIGYIGCAMTCVAMYSSGWGFTETPGTLNQKLTGNGGYIDEAIVWGAISKFYPKIKSTGLTLCTNKDAPISQITASLASGQPVIVEVDFSPAAGLQTHWVLLYASQGDDYLMLDPWPYPSDTQPVTLMSRFSHGQPLQRTIKAVAWYQYSASTPGGSTGGSTPPPTTTPTPAPTPVVTDLVIQVLAAATAGIKLHTQASQDSIANYAELPGVPLNVIEAKAGAQAKIGQNGQWIYVQDPQGHQGFVAAWLVQQSTATTPSTPTPTPQPAPTPSTPTPSTPTPSTPTPGTTNLVVQVVAAATAGIKLHTQASQDSNANYAEMPGVQLNVIEANAGALTKIGQNGQWIYVQDPQGHTGFVAAWLVEQSTATTPSTPIPSTPTPSTPTPSTPTPSTPTPSTPTPSTPIPTTPTPDPTPEAPPPTGEPQRLQVTVINSVGARGLVVRQQPSPGGSAVNVEKAGARLTVIEPADTAMPKIGKAGQWVAVKASNNQRGYVMAQYIQLKQ